MNLLMKGYASARVSHLGSIKRALNETGWIDEEVIAAGDLRQGKPPSIAGLITGTALIEVARRRSKSLPRHFVLAVTATHVLAYRAFQTGDDSDSQAEPYTVRIQPEACGAWPRDAVRLVDLQNGAQSDTATLELPNERVPVMRVVNDPNTDELVHLLSGGVGSRGTSTGSARHGRGVENRESLRRASGRSVTDDATAAADAERGRPDFELTGWAERRGLEHRGSIAQGGHLSVTCPWSPTILFNVLRGVWPGGTYGVLCHETRLFTDDARGYFRGGEGVVAAKRNKAGAALDVVDSLLPPPIFLPTGGRPQGYMAVPYTCAGARVPHVGALTGLHVARRAERYTDGGLFDVWEPRALDDLGFDEPWIASVRKHSDPQTVERLLRGPIRDLLSVQQGLGFEIRIEYGQVIVSRQDFLRRDEDLDALVAAAESLARDVREICVPHAVSYDDGAPIEPPDWLESARRKPKEKITLWPIGALVDRVVRIADQRGMTVESPRAFHRTFPGLNAPGEAFGVMHGRLPGTGLWGRLLCCAERAMVIPEDVRKVLPDAGGATGSDVAIVRLGAGAPATRPEGELVDGVRVAVADGVLSAWRTRRGWQADGEALDRLAADVAALVPRFSP